MRERQWIYAWDDSNAVYLLDLGGELIAQRRAPKEIVGVAGADDGSRLAVISRFGDLWWLDDALRPKLEVEFPLDPLAVALDPFGEYAVVASGHGENVLCDRTGKRLGDFSSRRPLKSLAFVPETGAVLGATAHDFVVCHDITGRALWKASVECNIGGLAVDGSGDVILLACFGHGVLRLSEEGRRVGSYRYERDPALVATDYAGSCVIAASLDRQLARLTIDGVVTDERSLEDKPIGLAFDALGRYAVLGFASGEVDFLPVSEFAAAQGRLDDRRALASSHEPTVLKRVTGSADESRSAVLKVIPKTKELAVYSMSRSVRVYDRSGEIVHESPGLPGVGRDLRANEHWLLASTDSTLLAYEPTERRSELFRNHLFEISHLSPLERFGEVIVCESCDRVSRLSAPEDSLWEVRLDDRLETLAVTPDGRWAGTFDDRSLQTYDGDGRLLGRYRSKEREPLSVLPLDEGWATFARESQSLRGHDDDARMLWATELPWRPWNARRLGPYLVVTDESGRSALLDQEGHLLSQNDEPRPDAKYFLGPEGEPARIFHVGETLIVSRFDGTLLWRLVEEESLHVFLADATGVWALYGRKLHHYPFGG